MKTPKIGETYIRKCSDCNGTGTRYVAIGGLIDCFTCGSHGAVKLLKLDHLCSRIICSARKADIK